MYGLDQSTALLMGKSYTYISICAPQIKWAMSGVESFFWSFSSAPITYFLEINRYEPASLLTIFFRKEASG